MIIFVCAKSSIFLLFKTKKKIFRYIFRPFKPILLTGRVHQPAPVVGHVDATLRASWCIFSCASLLVHVTDCTVDMPFL